MPNDLFRKSTLDEISSPEKLNEYIRITNPGAWALAIGCVAILGAIVVWLVLGSIPNTVSARGIIFPTQGTVTVVAPSDGKVLDMRVGAGSLVSPHDIIAVVPQQGILDQIEELKLAEVPDEAAIATLQHEFISKSVIRSPVSGVVLSSSYMSDIVTASEELARIAVIEEGTNTYSIISYIDMDTAEKLQTGMEVQVSPTFAPREEYGYMIGYVTKIGEYPVSEDDITAVVGNSEYVMGIVGEGRLVEVQVDIVLDANRTSDENAAQWTNPAGNNLKLIIGTECELEIVVREQKPYELVLGSS